MNAHKLSSVLKFTTIVCVASTVIYAVKFYDADKENSSLKASINIDKKTYSNDLNEIFKRYDLEVLKNKNLKDSFSLVNLEKHFVSPNYKENIVPKINPTASFNKKAYLSTIDSLKLLLASKHLKNAELLNDLKTLTQTNKDLNKKSELNENLIATTRNLTATNVFANGVKIISNNIIETKKFNNTEQIKVCFTLLENKSTIKGNKDIYVQIINPKNKVVSQFGDYIEFNDKSLYYSAKTNVFYDKEELDVCVFVASNKPDIHKGDYEINIFSGEKIIGNTTFYLK